MLELHMPPEAAARSRLLADPALRAELIRYVRNRGAAVEAEDVVQATLAEAVAGDAPSDPEALRRWLFGVARNKAVDCHRRQRREAELEPEHETAAAGVDPATRDLLRWAERELPDGDQAPATLEWLLREGAGEKLEEIAADEQVPAPRVRQRVARLRRHFRERWAAQLGAVALLGAVLAGALVYWKRRAPEPQPPAIVRERIDPERERAERGRALRRSALERCAASDWQPCVAGLDRARDLDPAGDAAPEVQGARQRAAAALTSPPAPPETEQQLPAPKKTAPAPKRAPAPKPKAAPLPPGKNAPSPKTRSNQLDGFEQNAPQQQLDFKQ